MAKLTEGVVIRHPESSQPVFLPAGSDLPDWAVGLVGGHVLDGSAKKPASRAKK